MTPSKPESGAGRGWARRAVRWLGVRSGVVGDPDEAPTAAREWVLLAAALVAVTGVVLAAAGTPWALVATVAALGIAGTAGRRRPSC